MNISIKCNSASITEDCFTSSGGVVQEINLLQAYRASVTKKTTKYCTTIITTIRFKCQTLYNDPNKLDHKLRWIKV